jgi:lysophospholipase L1-like esterase
VRVIFVLASLCSLSLVGCSASVVPGTARPSAATPAPTTAATGAATSTAHSPQPTEGVATLKYVALGDSYTIGTSVKPRERWPNQLARTLNPSVNLELVDNLGANGYSTQDVIDHELQQLPSLRPDFLSLLIGVNDVVRGVDIDDYRSHLRTIFAALLEQVPANRILLVTTPDYTLTPQGAEYGDPARQSAKIHVFNDALRDEGAKLQLLVVDITPVADTVPDDRSLVADDGLHPSGKQYAAWVELIAPPVRKLLRGATTP